MFWIRSWNISLCIMYSSFSFVYKIVYIMLCLSLSGLLLWSLLLVQYAVVVPYYVTAHPWSAVISCSVLFQLVRKILWFFLSFENVCFSPYAVRLQLIPHLMCCGRSCGVMHMLYVLCFYCSFSCLLLISDQT